MLTLFSLPCCEFEWEGAGCGPLCSLSSQRRGSMPVFETMLFLKSGSRGGQCVHVARVCRRVTPVSRDFVSPRDTRWPASPWPSPPPVWGSRRADICVPAFLKRQPWCGFSSSRGASLVSSGRGERVGHFCEHCVIEPTQKAPHSTQCMWQTLLQALALQVFPDDKLNRKMNFLKANIGHAETERSKMM